MSDPLMYKIALIGVLGIAAQWIAWRTAKPAIVFLLAAGIVAGPVLHLINPEADFGDLRQPIIKLAVAVILFEGGLSLNLRDLREAGSAVWRLILFGVPLGWLTCTLAVHFGAGLEWPIAALFGGILIVTGPTVIGPMLRAINVPRRIGDTLKWEAIINDPVGTLLAIAIFAQMGFDHAEAGSGQQQLLAVAGASLLAALIGFVLGWGLSAAFPRNLFPEYLKAPTLLTAVIAGFVLADTIHHETGLITVTVMGVVMGNRPTFSSGTLRRFKEDLAVILISGVFIILSAALDWEVVSQLRLRFVLFLAMLMFVARPVTVLVSLLGSTMPWRERLFIAWIAPRGIVAVAITGLFALRLSEQGVPGAEALVPLAFATAIVTIVGHGFTARFWARRLGIDRGAGHAFMLIGINSWSLALAEAMGRCDLHVVMVDGSKFALRAAKRKQIEAHHGDILDDDFRHRFDWGEFQQVAACSDSDAYNALVCSELGPELGFDRVLQVAPDQRSGTTVPRGGTLFAEPIDIYELQTRIVEGWDFSRTRITEQFGYDRFTAQLDAGAAPIAVIRANETYSLFSSVNQPMPREGDTVIGFFPPDTVEELRAKRDAKAQPT